MTTGQPAEILPPDPGSRPLHRQEQLRRLMRMRRAAEHLEAALFLERRAEHVANPVLASLLRERAGERRDRGERILAGPSAALPASRRSVGGVEGGTSDLREPRSVPRGEARHVLRR